MKNDWRSGESTRECSRIRADITVQSVQRMKRKESGEPDKQEDKSIGWCLLRKSIRRTKTVEKDGR
jgi:hypothetical protein